LIINEVISVGKHSTDEFVDRADYGIPLTVRLLRDNPQQPMTFTIDADGGWSGADPLARMLERHHQSLGDPGWRLAFALAAHEALDAAPRQDREAIVVKECKTKNGAASSQEPYNPRASLNDLISNKDRTVKIQIKARGVTPT